MVYHGRFKVCINLRLNKYNTCLDKKDKILNHFIYIISII